MWEAIASNQRRSRFLISLLAVLLVGLGAAFGMADSPGDPAVGGAGGALVALVVYFVMLCTSFFAGSDILLSAAGAHPIQKQDHPRLWNVVEEMTIASGLPAMPAVYIIDDDHPNAFAVGRRPEKAAVAITSGLLKRLTRDELQGVIAHEIGHIRNADTRFMTLASVMVGAIAILSEIFLRTLRFQGSTRRSSRDSDSGQLQAIIFVITIVAAILAPLFANLLYFACSRRREYLADASAARFTRYPEGLASALEKISDAAAAAPMETSGALAPLYIVNPLQGAERTDPFSTHPPTVLRIKVLRGMGGMAGLSDYEAAFKAATGAGSGALGNLTPDAKDSLPARAPNAEPAEGPDEPIARVQEVQHLLGRIGQLIAIPCPCGVNIKVPPNFTGEAIDCPRCGTRHAIPRATTPPPIPGRAASDAKDTSAAAATLAGGTLRYERQRPGEWEAFRCACGQSLQLSPRMAAPLLTCPKCRQKIEIGTPAATGAPAKN